MRFSRRKATPPTSSEAVLQLRRLRLYVQTAANAHAEQLLMQEQKPKGHGELGGGSVTATGVFLFFDTSTFTDADLGLVAAVQEAVDHDR